jgi:uncharacterized protein YciI
VYFLLTYDVVDRFVEKRVPFRADHLRRVMEAHARGEIFLAGAFGDPPEGALLVFRGDTSEAAETFAREDPYVTHGLVTAWRVRPWNVVAGP